MPDPKEDVPLPSGGYKEPSLLNDDEQNGEVPAETGPEPEQALDDVIGGIDVNAEDEEDDVAPDKVDVEPGSDADSDDESLGVESDLDEEEVLEPDQAGRPSV
jgi:hypothetical protein